MALVKKYYSFTDPVNGQITKGYGYSATSVHRDAVVKVVGNEVKVVKNDSVEKEHSVTPQFENVTELTQAEFDSLDVSQESLTSKLRRERELLGLKRVEERFNNPVAAKTIDEVVNDFKKVAGK